MDTSCLPQFATFLALGDWTTFALDLEELSVGVIAGRSSAPFYARFADERRGFVSCCGGEIAGEAKGEVYQANFFSLIRTCVKISKRRNTKNDEETDHDYSICSEDEDEDVEDKVETRKPTRQSVSALVIPRL